MRWLIRVIHALGLLLRGQRPTRVKSSQSDEIYPLH